MIPGELYDIIVACDGRHRLVIAADAETERYILEHGRARLGRMPDLAGVFRVTARFRPVPDDATWRDWRLDVVRYEPMTLAGTGDVVTIPEEIP